MKFEGRLWHCLTCDNVALRCDACGNTSCNGGGCDKCLSDYEELHRMRDAGELPPTRGLPKFGGGFDILVAAAQRASERNEPIDNGWIDAEYAKMIAEVEAKENAS